MSNFHQEWRSVRARGLPKPWEPSSSFQLSCDLYHHPSTGPSFSLHCSTAFYHRASATINYGWDELKTEGGCWCQNWRGTWPFLSSPWPTHLRHETEHRDYSPQPGRRSATPIHLLVALSFEKFCHVTEVLKWEASQLADGGTRTH